MKRRKKICRHKPGDRDCSSHPDNVSARAYESAAEDRARTQKEYEKIIRELQSQIPPSPDSNNYEVERVEQVCNNLVMVVKYPNCAKCAYEGLKVLVFRSVSLADAIKWRKIDPHFRPLEGKKGIKEAPPPIARFPGTDEGWHDAIAYAKTKTGQNR
jgi:hypothetical protein